MKRLSVLLLLLLVCSSKVSFAQSLHQYVNAVIVAKPLINHPMQDYFATCLQQGTGETQNTTQSAPEAQRKAPVQPASAISVLRLTSNPAMSSTRIAITLSQTTSIVYRLFDVAGRVVLTVEKPETIAGSHLWFIDTAGLPSGAYLLSVTDGISQRTLHLSVLH